MKHETKALLYGYIEKFFGAAMIVSVLVFAILLGRADSTDLPYVYLFLCNAVLSAALGVKATSLKEYHEKFYDQSSLEVFASG